MFNLFKQHKKEQRKQVEQLIYSNISNAYVINIPLLTNEQISEYEKLVQFLAPNFLVFPQVAALSVFKPRYKNDYEAITRINTKIIDYVITNTIYKPLAIITKSKLLQEIANATGLLVAESVDELIEIYNK